MPLPRLFLSLPPWPTLARRLALAAVLPLALQAAAPSAAHDWPSPQPVVDRSPPPAADWTLPLWAGPTAGAPPAPAAADCRRAPRPLELRDPQAQAHRDDEHRHRRERLAASKSLAPPAPAAAEDRADARRAAGGAGRSATIEAEAAPQHLAASPGRPRPQAEAPVAAGVVDDNADFGSFLAYRERQARLPVRARDVTERYRLSVRDAAGRPVPDAEVSIHSGSEALPIWARTDAGGEAWLHPRVAALSPQDDGPSGAALLEVQVRKGAARGSALLRRGQRDALQVRLDAALPPERARLDLVFLVDATGSMADEIDKLTRSMRAMADQIARLPSRPDLCFALVAYRDRGDAFLVRGSDFSNDLGAFQRQLAALRADGGGDYPEALNEALHTSIHGLSWRGEGTTRLVVLLADAPPQLQRGGPYYDDDMQAALARGIKLFAVAASGLDPVGEYVFRQLAQYTGGRFVFLTYADARDPSRGPGRETTHEVENYSVESLDRLVVRLVREELAKRPA